MARNPTGAPAPQSRLFESLSQRKIPSLDGVRAVAVILVISHHAKVPFAPDGRGVLTFFVLSGFLITWMMLNESEKYGGISILNFYAGRVLRILPAFYVYLFVQVVAQLLIEGRPSASRIGDYLSALTFTSNYRFALMPHVNHACLHTWALSIEEQFYLLWPWFLVAFQKNLRKLTQMLVGAIVLVDVYRIVMFFHFHVSDTWLKFTFDSRVDHILVGCLLAVLLKRGALMRFWNLLTARTYISIIPLGLIVLSIALSFRYHLAYKYAVGFVLDPLLTAILLVQVIAMGNTWLWGWLNWSVTRYLGKVSYAVFLYHMLVFHAVNMVFGQQPLWFRVPATIAGAAVLGFCSFHLVERRFLRLKSRLASHPSRRPIKTTGRDFQFAGS